MKMLDKWRDVILGKYPPELRKPVCVEISNVAHWLLSENPKEVWNFNDFPNIAPPWPHAWYEWVLPRVINSEGVMHSHGGQQYIKRMGVYAYGASMKEGGWKMALTVWVEPRRHKRPPICVVITVFSPDAAGQQHDDVGRPCVLVAPHTAELDRQQSEELVHVFAEAAIFPLLMALSFLHCRNTQVVNEPPSPKLSKKHLRRYGPPHVYKRLVITPMAQTIKASGPPEISLAKRLHICRGHFKDYREGRGLFGKYHELVWWPMHRRGDARMGEVHKGYVVNPAQAGAQAKQQGN